ncbi:hypothetical protein [Rhizobium sp. L1K21]|uniref:hypothetical protein n=1 Tax=Rhizobium sp. L1K21 TaxID=2954933 RepID=UPI0027959251|nr:hypothetical protein [Rhizobium sp. L1K21]
MRVANAFREMIHKPVDFILELISFAFQPNTIGIRLGGQTLALFMIGFHIFGKDLGALQLGS